MSLLIFPSVRSQCDTTFPDGTVCDDSTDYTTMADPEACWKYYECEAGCVTNKVAACHASRGVTAVTCHVSRVQECEDDKKFDDRYFWCAFPHDVECGARPCPDGNVHCPAPATTQATTQDCSVTPPINCEETGHLQGAAV